MAGTIEERLAGSGVAGRGGRCGGRGGLPQAHDVSGDGGSLRFRNRESRHAGLGDAFVDQVAQSLRRSGARACEVDEAGAVACACAIFAMTASAVRIILPPAGLVRLRGGDVHREHDHGQQREE